MKKYKGIRVNKEKGTKTLDYRDNQKKRHRETIVGSITFAQELLMKRKTEIAEGRFFPNRQKQKLTFAEAADKYWALHLSKKKSAPKMKYTLEYLKKQFRNVPLVNMTTEKIQEFYNQRRTEVSPSTANRHLTLLNAIINKMIRLKIYKGENPCIGMVKEKENPAREQYLEPEEIAKLVNCIQERSKALILFAVYTGMRRGEILRVDWKDINFSTNMINIDESKSGRKREVPINADLKRVLQNLNPQKSGKVFPLSEKQVEYDFKHALAESKIKKIRFHDLRHTFASLYMMRGGLLTDLQHILGHSDLKMTQRYAHFSPNYLRKSIAIMNDLVPVIV